MNRRAQVKNRLPSALVHSFVLRIVVVFAISLMGLLGFGGCGFFGDDSSPASQPGTANRTGLSLETPTPPPVIRGEELMGRLLFVRDGVVWKWEDDEARPYFGEGEAWQPAWSPDGLDIAYVERGDSYSNIWLMDTTTMEAERLTYNDSTYHLQSHERIYDTMWAFYPTWSPDGSKIAMVSQYDTPYSSPAIEYNLSLFEIPLNRMRREQIYADDEAHCGRICYQPDPDDPTDEPRYLIFTREAIGLEGDQELYQIDLLREVEMSVDGVPANSYDPTFSRDGEWLAFANRHTDGTDICVMSTSEDRNLLLDVQQVTSLGTARAPTFAPDLSQIAFLAISEGKPGFDLWVADLLIEPTGRVQAHRPRQLTHDISLDPNSGISWAYPSASSD